MRRWAPLLLSVLGIAGSAFGFDSYLINIPPNVMKGDPDVTFSITPYQGANPDLTPHNIYISLPAGLSESPLADPPNGLDWSSVVSWGLITTNGVSPGNTPIIVTQALSATPVVSQINFNLQNTVKSFEIVPPAGFTGTAGTSFQMTVRAKDGLNGGGAVVSGFNDNVIVSASTGDVVVNGAGNIVSGGDFVNGEAVVTVMLRGTDPNTRTNRIFVTATINYFSLGLASGYVDVNMDPGAYHHVVMLFPGETLVPGKILIPSGKSGSATAATANLAVPNVTVYLVDQFNNPLINPPAPVTLAFESLSYPNPPRPPNDSVPGLKVINSGNNVIANGEFIFYKGNETHQVRVYDFDDPGKNSVTSVLVNSGAANLIEVTAISSPQIPGQSFLVSARVVDGTPAANTVTSYNNAAVSVALTNCAGVNFPSGTLDGNPVTVGAQSTVAFASGLFNGPLVVFPKVAAACVKFDDGVGHFGESAPFSISYGNVISLHVVLPGQSFTPGQYPGVSPSTPTTQLAGASVTAQVYVVDQGWNVIDNVTGGWTPGPVVMSLESDAGVPGYVDLNGGSPVMPNSGASASVTNILLRTAYPAGNGRMAANMSGLTGRSSLITINPGAYNQIVFVAPGETLASGIQTSIEPDGKTGLPTTQVVNINFPIGVYLTDSYFNPIINPPLAGSLWPSLTFSLTAPTGGVVTFPFTNPFAMTSGSFANQVGLGTLGANTLRVVDTSPTAKTVNQVIDVTPGDVTRFLVTPNSASSTADPISIQTAGVAFNLTFKAFDQYNNVATNFGGVVQLQLWENGAPVPYAGTISPASVTFVAHPVTGGVVANQPITVTYAGPSLGVGADQLQVRAYVTTPTLREGFSAFFSVQELSTWSDVVVTLPGETRQPGLGPPYKTGSATAIPAGNSFAVTVTAVDSYGNKVDRAATADLAVPTANVFSNLGSPAQVTLSQGVGVGFAQVYTAGSSVFVASVTANGFNDTSNMTVSVGSYSASTGRLVLLAPGEVVLPGSPSAPGKNSVAISSIQANTSMTYSLLACDRFYNRDTTYSGNTISLSSDDGAISLSNLAVNSGSATVANVFLKGNLPNPSTVRVTATDQSAGTKTSYSDLPVTPGAAYLITVPSTATVGTLFPMTVELIDPNTGLPMVGATNSIFIEALLSSGTAATVPIGVAVATLNNGSATIQQSYSHVETIKIRVTDSFNRLSESGNISVLPNGLKYVITLPATKTTDDTFSATVGLYDTVQDLYPIRSSSYQHTFYLWVEAGALPGEGTTPVSAATLTDGVASFNFSYTKAEHIVVRASGTVAGFSSIAGLKDMDITPGAYVKVQILAPGEVGVPGVPSLTGKNSSGLLPQAAKESFVVTVNAVDRYWNVATSVNTPASPTLRLSASDGSLAALPLQGFANGQALFSGVALTSPPQVTLTATDTSSTSLFPQSVAVVVTGRAYVPTVTANFPPDFYSGPPRDFDVDLTLRRYSGGSTGTIVMGYSGNVFITALSPSLQPLSVSNVVIVSPSLPDPTQPNMVHMDPSGILNLTLAYRVAEDVVLKFTDADGWQGFSDPIHFIPREVDYVATTPAEAPVGPPDTFSMTITPKDTDTGTTAKNWSRSITVAAVSPAANPVTGTLQVTNLLLTGGASTFQQAFSQAGVFYFTVSDGVKTSSSSAMNFLPGALAYMTTDIPTTIEAGSTQTVHVSMFDSFLNPIPLLNVAYALSDSSFGTLSTLSGVSDSLGVSTTVFSTNGQKSGAGWFRGTSGSTSVQQAFRLLGPPLTSLRVGGRGIEEGKGYAIKPTDPIFMDIAVEPGTTLLSVSYSVNGGALQTSNGPFVLLPSGLLTFELPLGTLAEGRYTVEYYGETLSGLTHKETVKTSKTFFVSAVTTAEEGLVNYPNPFRAGQDLTYLEYVLSGDAGARLTIYDMMGQRVHEQSYSQGEVGGASGLNRISWDGKNDDGVVVGNGGYVAVLEASGMPKLKRKIAVKK
jgi:hypothetical protein